MRGDSLKERILRVATIEEVVAAYVPLQRSGAGYVGLCPFHADKHPSLHVHPGKQFFKCFACGEGGDLFAFVQKIEDVRLRKRWECWRNGIRLTVGSGQ